MKLKLIFPALFILAVVISSCKKEMTPSSESTNLKPVAEKSSIKKIDAVAFNVKQYKQAFASNESRLTLSGHANRGQHHSITVPDDYATIQEAVDAASENATIFVKSGTYYETVLVTTHGLNIQAKGGDGEGNKEHGNHGVVLLNGGFVLMGDADNVKIQKFTIDMTTAFFSTEIIAGGVLALGVTGTQVVENTIYGMGYFGVQGVSVRNMIIKDNNISGMAMGIMIMSDLGLGNGSSKNNTISKNTVSGIMNVAAISLQGNSDNNLIAGNTVTDNPFCFVNIVFIGIPYIGDPRFGSCDNNIVKNNTGNNSASLGFYIQDDCHNNTIGPNNKFNTNGSYGMYFYNTSNNHVFNNTALNNGLCDIFIMMSSNITLNNNTTGCVTQF